MPRKTFLAHLKEARSANLPSIIAVEGGMNTGLFSFVYMSNYLPESSVVIQGEVPEVSDYPTRHDCFLFIDRDQNPPPVVPTTLSNLSVKGKSLLETLTIVATALDKALDPTSPIEISDSDEEHEDDFECDGNDNDGFSSESDTTANNIHSCTTRRTPSQSTAAKRIRSDLRAVKRAGFKFGILGDISSTGIVCVSIRITKLGISEEAMKAWGLRRKQYLVLMIRFLDGYQAIDQVLDESTLSGKTQIRVGLCERYKPGFEDATGMFTKLPAGSCDTVLTQKSETATLNESATTTNFPLEPLFIGGPINDLFKDRFASILRYRLTCAFPWSGAENFVHDVQGKNAADVNADEARYLARENMEGRTLPPIVVADTIEETISGVHLSFPLSAMQFLLRHFVRCTEFCLVCHCTVDTSFEALKPYVCSRPLCLYQYMALGFGPSIGWEIITQPYTVDMLVSFTYVSARSGLLRDFPTGIAMRIPLLPQLGMVNSGQHGYGTSYRQAMDTNSTQADMKCEKSFSAKLNRNNSELLIESKVIKTSPVRAGDWLVVQNVALDGSIHYRVADTALFPVIMLDGEGLFVANHKPETYKTTEPSLAQEATIPGYMNVDVFVYEHDFNELGISQRRNCITMLLDTLPGILKLREHLLSSNQGSDPQLRTRKHDLSDAALNLLRWIIASNRSCIMQVDRLTDKHAEGTASKSFTAEDRVSGMDDYMQFRFAQGG
jgi:ubiquitin-conjugating enzyme E2 Q